jgi:hypothetical protein
MKQGHVASSQSHNPSSTSSVALCVVVAEASSADRPQQAIDRSDSRSNTTCKRLMRLCGAVGNHYQCKHVEIAYPEHFAFNADQTAIRLVARYDIAAINPAAIVEMIGVTASPHPVAVRPPHLAFEAGAGPSQSYFNPGVDRRLSNRAQQKLCCTPRHTSRSPPPRHSVRCSPPPPTGPTHFRCRCCCRR